MVAALKRPHPRSRAQETLVAAIGLHTNFKLKRTSHQGIERKTFTITTESDQDTIRVGQEIGRLLLEGDVVGLAGELGSGKTWLTKGIALGLG